MRPGVCEDSSPTEEIYGTSEAFQVWSGSDFSHKIGVPEFVRLQDHMVEQGFDRILAILKW